MQTYQYSCGLSFFHSRYQRILSVSAQICCATSLSKGVPVQQFVRRNYIRSRQVCRKLPPFKINQYLSFDFVGKHAVASGTEVLWLLSINL